jgi:uncharacterized membrane protein
MRTGRIEAFSDGVLAIVITIMVLELHVPEEATFDALRELWPVLLSYALSFVNLGIYWNNHHHLLHAATGVSAGVLWANLHLLFWLSLFPFTTAWMGTTDFDKVPVAAYGVASVAAAIAYFVLQTTIVRRLGPESAFAAALGRDLKGKLSPALYVAGILSAPLNRWVALSFYVAVALMWLVPDRRVERSLSPNPS